MPAIALTTTSAVAAKSTRRSGNPMKPSGHRIRAITMAPTNTNNDANWTARAAPRATPTVRLAPESATNCVALGNTAPSPTPNVNAPPTGCESADTTRHVTT